MPVVGHSTCQTQLQTARLGSRFKLCYKPYYEPLNHVWGSVSFHTSLNIGSVFMSPSCVPEDKLARMHAQWVLLSNFFPMGDTNCVTQYVHLALLTTLNPLRVMEVVPFYAPWVEKRTDGFRFSRIKSILVNIKVSLTTKWILLDIKVGVVSWGLGCGSSVPGVYADVQR